ncbi:MAG: ABC-three component system protein [Daejeonella sp.]
MTIDNIKEYIVCINGGSGVIFQPLDEQYSYILTAKHIFDDIKLYDDQVKINRFDPTINAFCEIDAFPLQTNINYFSHPDKDLAILKISRLNGADNLVRFDDPFRAGFEFSLHGFPLLRRNAGHPIDRIRQDLNLKISEDKSEGKREGVLSDNSTWEELVGQSGGGIFCVKGNYLYLLAIQNQVPNKAEYKGRIEFSELRNFDEIIGASSPALEPLVPPFIKSFLILKDDAFNLPFSILNEEFISRISKVLQVQTENLCNSNISPACIHGHLGDSKLLLSGQPKDAIYAKELWLFWLELITILSIVKGRVISKEDFQSIFNGIRLFHSDTDKDFWVEHLETMVNTDFSDLAQDGIVVVSSKKAPHNDTFVLDKELIPERIDSIRFNYEAAHTEFVYGEEDTNISKGSVFPYDKFQFVHLEYFKQKSIVDDYKDYADQNPAGMLKILKDKYGIIIK